MVKSLIAGFTDFKKDFFGNDKSFYEKLAKRGQKPKTIIISCSDSRVDPAILFGARPGDLFLNYQRGSKLLLKFLRVTLVE